MLEGLIAWVVTTIGRPMLSAGVLLVCFLMLCAQVRLGVIALVAAGGLGLAYWQQIVSFFPVG